MFVYFSGLCGSITTYSKFNQQNSLLLLQQPSDEGVFQITAIVAIIVALLTFSSSYQLGRDVPLVRNNMNFSSIGKNIDEILYGLVFK